MYPRGFSLACSRMQRLQNMVLSDFLHALKISGLVAILKLNFKTFWGYGLHWPSKFLPLFCSLIDTIVLQGRDWKKSRQSGSKHPSPEL